jgi:hypothetical protein
MSSLPAVEQDSQRSHVMSTIHVRTAIDPGRKIDVVAEISAPMPDVKGRRIDGAFITIVSANIEELVMFARLRDAGCSGR